MGVNTVRLDVSAVANSDERLAAIRRAVEAARSAQLIVIISAHGGTAEQSLAFAGYLAGRFHKDRCVWLQPAFDPSCDGAGADRNRCISWSAWRAEQRALVHAIRSARHALADPALDAAPLGRPAPARPLPPDRHGHRLRRALPRRAAHASSRSPTASGSASCSPARARSAFAIIVDDLGRVGPNGSVDRPGWSDDFTAYVTNWTINRGGDGAIAAAWTRYGPRRMRARHGSGSRRFGAIYASRFLALTYALDHPVRAPHGLRGALA